MMAPKKLTADYLIERWPQLFHMAEAGSWAAIQEHGLLSTRALLDLFQVSSEEREAIESRRRPESVVLSGSTLGKAWIRDNRPINETVLARTLRGMTLEEWYRELNGRVFFWLARRRLDRLRGAKAYGRRKHDILTVDTAALMEAHGDEVELAHLNTGAVHVSADYERGVGTFRGMLDYPWLERVEISPSEPIVELTVPYAVRDITKLVVDVTTE